MTKASVLSAGLLISALPVWCGTSDIAAAIDCTNLVFTVSGGGEYWMPQTDVSHDGVDAVRCDAILTPAQDGFNHTDFALAATVTGPGRLSFWWKVENGGDGGFTFWFGKCNPTNGHYAVLAGLMDNDGVPHYEWRPFDEGGGFSADSVTGGCTDDGEWAKVVCDVGEGEHMFMWSVGTMFGRENGRAYLDEVTWIPAAADAIVIGGVAIPHLWLSDEAAPILAANSGNHESAAKEDAANGLNKVWECYVAGLNPTNATDVFRAVISIGADGEPVVGWEPDLNEGGTKHERVYTVEGKENLTDKSWAPTNSASRFFRVNVSMP